MVFIYADTSSYIRTILVRAHTFYIHVMNAEICMHRWNYLIYSVKQNDMPNPLNSSVLMQFIVHRLHTCNRSAVQNEPWNMTHCVEPQMKLVRLIIQRTLEVYVITIQPPILVLSLHTFVHQNLFIVYILLVLSPNMMFKTRDDSLIG